MTLLQTLVGHKETGEEMQGSDSSLVTVPTSALACAGQLLSLVTIFCLLPCTSVQGMLFYIHERLIQRPAGKPFTIGLA